MSNLFQLAPRTDNALLVQRYAVDQRVQVPGLLTDASAQAVHSVLARDTPWGLSWQAGAEGPVAIRRETVMQMPDNARRTIGEKLTSAMRGREYAFTYSAYPMLTAYLEQWSPGGAHDSLLECMNAPPMLDFIRHLTGIPELIKADAQATLYGAGQFLAQHDDGEPARGRRVAYVLNLCALDWRPDWGGYLNFYDTDGDVIAGYRPRFNALNLFTVPQPHNVTYVPPFAPVGRYAITGWFRDR